MSTMTLEEFRRQIIRLERIVPGTVVKIIDPLAGEFDGAVVRMRRHVKWSWATCPEVKPDVWCSLPGRQGRIRLSPKTVVIPMLVKMPDPWPRLQKRAARGTREKFLAALDQVPDVPSNESNLRQ